MSDQTAVIWVAILAAFLVISMVRRQTKLADARRRYNQRVGESDLNAPMPEEFAPTPRGGGYGGLIAFLLFILVVAFTWPFWLGVLAVVMAATR